MGHKYVYGFEVELLVSLYDAWYSMVFGAVHDLSESQGRTSETPQQDAIITHSHVKMGGNHHNFITKLPRITCGVDTIWVIVDRLTKSAHLPIAESIYAEKLADIYIREVVVRHGKLVLLVSD